MRHSLFLLVLASCFVPREPAGRVDDSCAACHGDRTREGDALARAAPPFDLRGNTGVEYPGVGAHLRHLTGGPLFRAVACEQCHPVPAAASAAGHNDGTTQLLVKWDPGARTCEATCHGPQSGVWTRPRTTEEACGTCHGRPPPAPHPQTSQCVACHGGLDAGTHVDGLVQVVEASCDACHGAMGSPSLDGGSGGAHAAHLGGGSSSKAVACTTCHEVPATVVTAKHPNGGHAEVTLTGFSAASQTCTTGCHRGESPAWSSSAGVTCDSCHRSPPPAPHPQAAQGQCTLCHTFDRAHHVDGVVDVAVPASCDGCHGSAANAAPPRDVDGGTSTSRPGVGAHQVHLVGRGLGRTVQCSECHRVPAQVIAPGHVDGTAQVVFSGVAVSNLATPSYAAGSCANTACHDISNIVPGGGGGVNTAPVWTSVDGGQVTCTSCHGMPPPAPHPVRSDCDACHAVGAAAHVNGRVDFD